MYNQPLTHMILNLRHLNWDEQIYLYSHILHNNIHVQSSHLISVRKKLTSYLYV